MPSQAGDRRGRFTMQSRFLIRQICTEDARAFLEVHHAAVRGLAGKDCSSKVIEAWAPLPITAQQVEGVQSNPEGEYKAVVDRCDQTPIWFALAGE